MKNILLIIGIVLMLAGVFVWLNQDTSNWNTFTSEKYHYSIKYPLDFAPPKRQIDVDNYMVNFMPSRLLDENGINISGILPDRIAAGLSESPRVSVTVVPITADIGVYRPGNDLADWIRNNFNARGYGEAKNLKPLTINGLDAYSFENTNVGGAEATFRNIAILKGTTVYLIQNTPGRTADPDNLSDNEFMRMAKSLRVNN